MTQSADAFLGEIQAVAHEGDPVDENGINVLDPTDESLINAMRLPARLNLAHWSEALREHSGHPSFRTEDWPMEREVGFVCSCTGEEQIWRIPITRLRDRLVVVRESYDRFITLRRVQWKKTDKEWERAEKKARALLHSYLSREQRWELRGAKYFHTVGQDGRLYRIEYGSSHNVFLIRRGEKREQYCIVSHVPISDLMLAQKVLLERNIDYFMETANITPLTRNPKPNSNMAREQERRNRIASGLLADDPQNPILPLWRRIPDGIEEDPASWIAEQIASVQVPDDLRIQSLVTELHQENSQLERESHADADFEVEEG